MVRHFRVNVWSQFAHGEAVLRKYYRVFQIIPVYVPAEWRDEAQGNVVGLN